jgi:hypothetical protein
VPEIATDVVVVVGSVVVLVVLVLDDELVVVGADVVVVVGKHAGNPPHRRITPLVHRFSRGAFSKAFTQFSRAQAQTRAQR